MPGMSVAYVAWRHGTTRWQIYDWRKKLRMGELVGPERVAALPMLAELAVEGVAARGEMPAAAMVATNVVIVVGNVVIRVGADADEGLLTRSIRAARTSTS